MVRQRAASVLIRLLGLGLLLGAMGYVSCRGGSGGENLPLSPTANSEVSIPPAASGSWPVGSPSPQEEGFGRITPAPLVTSTRTLSLPTPAASGCRPTEVDQEWIPYDGRWWGLQGLCRPVVHLLESGTGQWLVVTVQREVEFQIPIVSILLIQVEGDDHLLLRERAEGGGHYFDFTDSGEVVWTDDEGRVCLGNSTGYQCYEAPSPALQVWYISEGMVLVQDSHEELWRFNPDRGKWEPISGFQGRSEGWGFLPQVIMP